VRKIILVRYARRNLSKEVFDVDGRTQLNCK